MKGKGIWQLRFLLYIHCQALSTASSTHYYYHIKGKKIQIKNFKKKKDEGKGFLVKNKIIGDAFRPLHAVDVYVKL